MAPFSQEWEPPQNPGRFRELELQEALGPTNWVVPAIDLSDFDTDERAALPPEEFAKLVQPAFPGAFTLSIYCCKVCGYLEFFDVEVPDERS